MHNTHVYLLKHTHAHAYTHTQFAEERTLAMLLHTKCKKRKLIYIKFLNTKCTINDKTAILSEATMIFGTKYINFFSYTI